MSPEPKSWLRHCWAPSEFLPTLRLCIYIHIHTYLLNYYTNFIDSEFHILLVQSTLVNPTYLVPTIKLSDYEGVGITG